MGGYEPNPIALGDRGIPERFPLPAPRRGLGPFRAADGAGARPRAGARDGRHQAADQRAGELHPRRQLHHRRGAGAAGTFTSAPASTPSASRRPAAPARRSPNGSPGASRRSTSGRSTSAASAAATATRTGCARARSRPTASTTPWPGRSRSIAPAARCAARRSMSGCKAQGAVLRREARLGAPQLVRRRRARSRATSTATAGRTGSRRSAREHRACREAVGRLRPDLLRQVPAGRARRRGGAVLALRQRRRQAAGQPRLHPDAQPRGRDRVRPDRGAARRRPLLHRHRHRLRHPRLRLDPPQHPRRPRRALVDVTSAHAVLSLMGPRARDVLAAVTADAI